MGNLSISASATINNENYTWEPNDWQAGDPITKEKMNKTEDGLSIAFYKIAELLDKINTNDTTVKNMISALAETDESSGATRLDDLETEIGGTRNSGNGYTGSRIDTIESTTQSNSSRIGTLETKTSALETKTGDADFDSITLNMSDKSNLTKAIISLAGIIQQMDGSQAAALNTAIINEIWGTNGPPGLTRTQISLFVATNNVRSDQITINVEPLDHTLFFVAVPNGTLGTNQLTLVDKKNQEGSIYKDYSNHATIKYAENSLIGLYKSDSNTYYIFNTPLAL